MIPVFDPLLYGDEAKYVAETLAEGNISGTSPTVQRFEAAFASRIGARHCVAAANGTAAPHLALMALGVKPGDEVLVPDFTIISDALAVVLCDATPVFVDVSEKDWCLNTSLLDRYVTSKTVGILAVHIYGHSCDVDTLGTFAKRHNLWLLEDAAQAHGTTWRGKSVGTFGNAGTYSFYSNKLVTMGEGGAVVTDDEALHHRMKILSNLAFDPQPERRFIHLALSHNYRLSGIQAAMGLAQISHWDDLLARRTKLRAMYADVLSTIKWIRLPEPASHCKPSFWASTILVEDGIRVPDLQKRLLEKGVDTRRFFFPLHAQPALATHHRQREERFPVSERLFDQGLYLPSSSKLTWENIKTIATSLKSCVK